MRITVASELCMGHGQCAMRAPEVFELSELGTNEMDEFEVPAGLEEQARSGVLACPEQILSIIEEADAQTPPATARAPAGQADDHGG